MNETYYFNMNMAFYLFEMFHLNSKSNLVYFNYYFMSFDFITLFINIDINWKMYSNAILNMHLFFMLQR